MDPFTFAQQVSSQEERDPELDDWAHRYLESSALQTLRAARYVECAKTSIVNDYKSVLQITLERLPDGVRLEVSQDLFEILDRIAGPELNDLLTTKVKTASACF